MTLGQTVGLRVGAIDGIAVGRILGAVVGITVGARLGITLGMSDGQQLGSSEGITVDINDGDTMGPTDGFKLTLGIAVGMVVGASETNSRTIEPPVALLLSLTYTMPVLSTKTPIGSLTAVLVAIPETSREVTPCPVPR